MALTHSLNSLQSEDFVVILEPSLGLKKGLLIPRSPLPSKEHFLPYQNWSYRTDNGNVDRLCVGTGIVWRRDPVLEGNAGISELSAAIGTALARETAPEAVGEESVP